MRMHNPLSRLFKARDKPADQPTDSVSEALSFNFGSSNAGKTVNPRNALQLSTLYACVRVIAETLASLPLHLYENVELGSVKAIDHPLYRLLHDEPNPEMTSFVFREAQMTHLLLWGNAYAQIIRDGRGNVLALYPLLPDKMTVDRDARGQLTYTYSKDGNSCPLRADEVLHIPGLGFDGVMGHSPIAMERNAIGLSLAAEEYGSRFFSNGARPSGVLTHPSTIKDTAKLRESWTAAYGGAGNAGKVAILEEGMKFEKISVPNNDAQFLETRKFQVAEIARIFRVPPHLVGDLEHATYTNIEHQAISFAMNTIRPWAVRLEQGYNRALLSEQDKGKYYARLNLDGLMRGDYESRMRGYAQGIQNGFFSVNDVREMESMNLLSEEEGGFTHMVNGNMISLASVSAADKTNAGKEEDSQ